MFSDEAEEKGDSGEIAAQKDRDAQEPKSFSNTEYFAI